MIKRPAKARTTPGDARLPIATVVAGSATTIFALIRAIIVINKPIPAVIPNFKFVGILGASLIGLKVAGKNLKKSMDVLADEVDNKWNQVREA